MVDMLYHITCHDICAAMLQVLDAIAKTGTSLGGDRNAPMPLGSYPFRKDRKVGLQCCAGRTWLWQLCYCHALAMRDYCNVA